jgi:hypothetical protein
VSAPPPSGFALYRPRAVEVHASGGIPVRVGERRSRVEAVREEWLIEDRWWTREPLRRHYFELLLEGGRCVTVFHDLCEGGWYEQRA